MFLWVSTNLVPNYLDRPLNWYISYPRYTIYRQLIFSDPSHARSPRYSACRPGRYHNHPHGGSPRCSDILLRQTANRSNLRLNRSNRYRYNCHCAPHRRYGCLSHPYARSNRLSPIRFHRLALLTAHSSIVSGSPSIVHPL